VLNIVRSIEDLSSYFLCLGRVSVWKEFMVDS
jgi:hypothetical protein